MRGKPHRESELLFMNANPNLDPNCCPYLIKQLDMNLFPERLNLYSEEKNNTIAFLV